MARANQEWPIGHQKIVNFLLDLIRKESFLKDVYKIRKTFSLPKEGLPYKPKSPSGTFKFPRALSLTEKEQEDFLGLMRWLGKKHRTGPLENMTFPLAFFVLYDLLSLPEYYDLCAVEDVKRKSYSKNRYGECLYSDSTHPVSLRITPYALKGDIVDYIERHYDRDIKSLQLLHEKGRSEMGTKRFRTNESFQLGDYIWKHINLDSKALAKKISSDLKLILNHGEVEKLKSLEKSRRK